MNAKTTLGILGGIAAILLVMPLLSPLQGIATQEIVPKWTPTGMVKMTNSTATLLVNPSNSTASISQTLNTTMPTTLTLTWTDLASLNGSAYQVDIVKNGTTVIATPLAASDSEAWQVGGSSYQVTHSSQVNLTPGTYNLVYSLRAKYGTVTVSQVSMETSTIKLLIGELGGYVPYLLLVAVIAGWATTASGFSSLKRDVERLRTLLSLKG